MEKLKQWNENTSITWWAEGRTQLNKVIRKYNKWIDMYTSNHKKTLKLLIKINSHLEKYYSNQDGGEGYREELNKMKSNVVTIMFTFIK